MADLEDTWGWVDQSRSVYVRDRGEDRLVGSFPDATAKEALACFQRKYDRLASQVNLLLQRVKIAESSFAAIRTRLDQLEEELKAPAVVGDIDALRQKIARARSQLENIEAQKSLELKEALAKRVEVVCAIEKISQRDLESVQWKELSIEIQKLQASWLELMGGVSPLPRAEADRLWRRFKKARSRLDRARNKFFAEQKSKNEQVLGQKRRLISRAEAIKPDATQAVDAYRKLLDEWKALPTGSKSDHKVLWEKFRAAGDPVYTARKQAREEISAREQAALEAKQELLKEAKALDKVDEPKTARKAYMEILSRWEKLGPAPREKAKELELALRRVETRIKKLEQGHWQKTNPELEARSESLRLQINSKLEKLSTKLSSAQANDQEELVQKLETEINQTKELAKIFDPSA